MKHSTYHKKVVYFCVGLVFAFSTITPAISHATTFYVAKTGNNTNSGTESSPFGTIKHGVTSLSAGDTLYVKAGTYSEHFRSWETPIPNGTSWNNPVTVAAYPGDKVTITPGSGKAFFWIKDGQAKYMIIDGFIVDGKGVAWHGFKFSDNTRYIRIQNTEIKNTDHDGLLISVCSGCSSPETAPHDTFHELIKVKIHHSGPANHPRHGLYVETSRNLVEHSEVYENTHYGAHFFRSKTNTSNSNIIRYNTFRDNNTGGKWGCGLLTSSGKGNIVHSNLVYRNFAGICSSNRSTDALIYNNISYDNKHFGIYIGNAENGTRAYHNTTYNNGDYGIFIGNNSKNATVRNTIAYQNGRANIFLAPGEQSGTTMSHNLTTNPKFLNASSRDFHLTSSSPAIDSGMIVNQVSTDYDGVARTEGNGTDIGAFEFPQTADQTPPETPKKVSIE